MPLLDDGRIACDRCGSNVKDGLAALRDGWSLHYPPQTLSPEDAGKKRKAVVVELLHCGKCTAELWLTSNGNKCQA